MNILRKHWQLSLFGIGVFFVGGCLLYAGFQQTPEILVTDKEAQPEAKVSERPTQQKPVPGETAQGGHWHSGEWHAHRHETHDTPSASEIYAPSPGAATTPDFPPVVPNADPVESEKEISNAGGTVWGEIFGPSVIERPMREFTVIFASARNGVFTIASDRNGEYKLAGLPEDSYSVAAWHHDRIDNFFDSRGKLTKYALRQVYWNGVTVVNGGNHYRRLLIRKRENIVTAFWNLLRFRESQGGGFQLRIRGNLASQPPSDATATIPIEDAIVEIYGDNGPPIIIGRSDATGQYQHNNVRPDNYNVKLRIKGYRAEFPLTICRHQITAYNVHLSRQPQEGRIVLTKDGGITSLEGPEAERFRQSATIYGFVNTYVEGLVVGFYGMRDVQVELVNPTGEKKRTTSGDDGVYTFTGVPAGSYRLNLRKKGYIDRIGIPVTIAEDANDVLDVYVSQQAYIHSDIVHLVTSHGNSRKLSHDMVPKVGFFAFIRQHEGGTFLIVGLSLVAVTLLIGLSLPIRRFFAQLWTQKTDHRR